MSDREPDGPYVYQPDPPREDGRCYAVGGIYPAVCKQLTKQEATALTATWRVMRAIQESPPKTRG
jgi:hypothetical protein